MISNESQSFRQNKNNVIYGPVQEIPIVHGIGETLFNCMKKHGNNVAQIDAITGQKQTYSEFLEKCIKTSVYMQSIGIKPNDVVSICSYNHLDNFVPFVAGIFIGAIVACTDPKLSLLDTIYLLEQIRPKIIFVSDNAIDLIEKTLERAKITAKIVVFGKHQKYQEFEQINFENDEESFVPFTVKNTKCTAVVTFSSGTTGFPKGVCLSHFGLLGPIISKNTKINNSVILFSSTPYWLSAVHYFIYSIIFKLTRIVISDFDENKIWSWISTYKISVMFLATSQYISLIKKGPPVDADVSSLKLVFTGGTSVSKEQILKIRLLFPSAVVIYAYGLTETSGLGLNLTPLDNPDNLKIYEEKPNSIGRPQPYCTYKVVDVETEKNLGPNEVGELRIKTDFCMNGYYNHDSKSSWDSEDFIKTGDLVYYDQDFSFHYVDRMKEMLKYRSWQIAPAFLENIILSHPAVKNVVVVGKFDEEDGDHPVAVVEIKEPVAEKEIENFVAEQVADTHRLRGGVKFVDKIPTSVTGKNRRMFIKNLVNDNISTLDNN